MKTHLQVCLLLPIHLSGSQDAVEVLTGSGVAFEAPQEDGTLGSRLGVLIAEGQGL